MFSEVCRMKRLIFGVLAVWVITVCACLAAPEPAIVPRPSDWTVETAFEHPEQIVVVLRGENEPRRFWYTILTLSNKTKRDVDFYPKCELMTDTFDIIPAGKGVRPQVFKQIKLRHQLKYPFIEYLEDTSSRILQGDDNTKDIAVIWPDFDANARNIKLFISGLSNETVVIDHPVAKDASGRPKKVYLRKTLELSYSIGGDPIFRSDARMIYKGKRWVMR